MDKRENRAEMISAVAAIVGDDGTGVIGVCVDSSPPTATAREIADGILEAREEWQRELESERESEASMSDKSDYDVEG